MYSYNLAIQKRRTCRKVIGPGAYLVSCLLCEVLMAIEDMCLLRFTAIKKHKDHVHIKFILKFILTIPPALLTSLLRNKKTFLHEVGIHAVA